jgi:hypothetical protein
VSTYDLRGPAGVSAETLRAIASGGALLAGRYQRWVLSKRGFHRAR